MPYVNTLNNPFFEIDDFISTEVSASFLSAFPLWDAAVIILLMKDYRQGAISLFRRNKKKQTDKISIMNT